MKPNELVELINKYALIDIDVSCAYAKKSPLKKLPDTVDKLIATIHPHHGDMIKKYIQGTPVTCHRVQNFNPIERLFYYDKNLTDDEYMQVKSFFLNRAISLITGKGEDTKATHSFQFDWFIILDPENSTLFSFIFNLQD